MKIQSNAPTQKREAVVMTFRLTNHTGVAYPPLLETRVWEFGPYSLIIIILIIVRFQTNPKRWLVDWGGHQVLTPVVRDASYSKAWVEFCFFQGVDDVQANKPPNSGNYNILALIESRLP